MLSRPNFCSFFTTSFTAGSTGRRDSDGKVTRPRDSPAMARVGSSSGRLDDPAETEAEYSARWPCGGHSLSDLLLDPLPARAPLQALANSPTPRTGSGPGGQ